jgi:hypothetical protein
VAQAFQPVLAQAKACGYNKSFFERNSVLDAQTIKVLTKNR